MWWWIIGAGFCASGAGLLGWIFLGKIKTLRMMDVGTIPEEKERQVKERLLLQRFARLQSTKVGGLVRAAHMIGKDVSRTGRRAVQRLYRLEQYYQKLRKEAEGGEGLSEEAGKRLMEEAEELIKQEEYIPAEKKYIEIISHHPKHIKAYEGLGHLYLRSKNLSQARETFQFAERLNEKDASVQMSLAELELAEERPQVALSHARRAVEIRPRNPRYLDAYIEIAFLVKALEDVKKGVTRLKEANPENQKIAEWEKRMKELSETPEEG
jgi:tetratricopeptide (TPR) repeat protein